MPCLSDGLFAGVDSTVRAMRLDIYRSSPRRDLLQLAVQAVGIPATELAELFQFAVREIETVTKIQLLPVRSQCLCVTNQFRISGGKGIRGRKLLGFQKDRKQTPACIFCRVSGQFGTGYESGGGRPGNRGLPGACFFTT